MTNWEKFKETFIVSDLIEPIDEICEIVSCDHVECRNCPFGYGDFWSQEYKEKR